MREPRTQAVASRWTFTGGEGDDVFALLLTADDQLLWMTDESSALRPVELRAPAAQLYDGGYHHVAATWSGAGIAMYVDGTLVASAAPPGGTLNAGASTQFRLGSSSGAGNPYYYSGGIDEPAVIRRALTATEVAAIHAAGSAGKCEAPIPGTEQARLTAADGSPDDWFGRSVAVHGDNAVVGAHLDDDRGTDAGAAYVYVRSGFVWTLQAKLTAADAAPSDHFGYSVGIDGDTVVVGAFQDDDKGTNSGSAYVFQRSGEAWTQQAKLTAATGWMFDNFGRTVAVDADTVVVGALFHDDGGSNAGAAWVFARSSSSWTEQAKLVAADPVASHGFGYAVGLDGDRAVIGAHGDAGGGTNAGAAYVFAAGTGGWSQQAKLVASDAAASDVFGAAVSIDGKTAVVGTHRDDDVGTDSGSAYVFTENDGVWAEQRKLVGGDVAAGDGFGISVAVHSGTAVIGAHLADTVNGTDSGSAYVFVS